MGKARNVCSVTSLAHCSSSVITLLMNTRRSDSPRMTGDSRGGSVGRMVSGAVVQDGRVRGVGGVGNFSDKRWNDRRMDREWARAGDGRKRVVFRSGNGVGRGEAAEGRSFR